MSRAGRGQSASRVVGYRVVVPESDEARVEHLLELAKAAGVVTQWDGSRGYFWFNGAPGATMRELRAAIGGEHLSDDEWGKRLTGST